MQPIKGLVGKAFKKEAKVVMDALARLGEEDIANIEKSLSENGCVHFSCLFPF